MAQPLKILVAVAVPGLVLALASGAGAATITVEGSCSLADAVRTANADVGIGGCVRVGENGADTVVLSPGTHALTSVDNGSGSDLNGLPVVGTDITIEGNGATITRPLGTSAPFFRTFDVAAPGQLTLRNVTVHGGRLQASGGLLDGGGTGSATARGSSSTTPSSAGTRST